MIEPAMTPEQSAILCDMFAQQIILECHCLISYHCFRCQYLHRIRTAFPGTFVQACVVAANINPLEHDNG